MKPARWALSSLALLLALLGEGAAFAAAAVQELDAAQVLLGDAQEPPPDTAPWQPQALPDNWNVSRNGVHGYGWYRVRFELPQLTEEPYAVYMPWLRTIGAVYVNGVLVGRTGEFGKVRFGPRPQYFAIPGRLLHSGINTLHIRLFVAENWRGAVSAVTLGPDTLVRPRYEWRYFVQITGPQLSSVLSAALGLFMLALWVGRRHESMYGYFGLAGLCWSLIMSRYFLGDPPLPTPVWMGLLGLAQVASNVLLWLFALRYAGLKWPRVERSLWIWAAISLAFVVGEIVSFPQLLRSVSEIWGYTEVLVTAGWLAVLARAGWRRAMPERLLVSLAVAFIGGTMVRDMIAGRVFGALDFLYYPYSALPICVAIGWVLADRFVRSLNESEHLNAQLEARVAQKHAELEENYGRMHELEGQRAVAAERQRIMSDMHDGVGGQLISTLSLVEQGELSQAEVAAALRECLDDLRLTIDSLEPTEHDLLPVLGNLRYRLDERLKKQGIDLDWQVSEIPKLACLTPQNVMHVLRILQEAFSNVLQHARANRVRVETGVDPRGENVYIRVRDNGTGFTDDRPGYGLANMRRRAQAIGAQLRVEPSPTGTTLSLLLPV
jgi:signal transduction histidine kinase